MPYFVVYGDVHPSMMVRIGEPELKELTVKLAIGIKPEDIRLQNKMRDGSRNLGTKESLNLNGNLYLVVSNGGYLSLEFTDGTNF